MIEVLIYLRFALLWSIALVILLAIYYGLKHYSSKDSDRYRAKFIVSGFAIFAIPIFILLYNSMLANIILNDIKNEVMKSVQENAAIKVNGQLSSITSYDIQEVLSNLNFWNTIDRSRSKDGYLITLDSGGDPYEFYFQKGARGMSKYHLYTNEYNFELELASVNTNIFN